MNARLATALIVVLAGSPAFAGDAIELPFTAKDAAAKLSASPPQMIKLSATKPASVKKSPEGLEAPLYGMLATMATNGSAMQVIVDEPDGKDARIWVDANGNGDLTDDKAVDWKANGNTKVYMTSASVDIGSKDKALEGALVLQRPEKSHPKFGQFKDTLLYWADYCREGQAKLGDKSYAVVLLDVSATGDFRGKEINADDEKAVSGGVLLIDANGNGKFDKSGERFDVRKPFNIGGTTWEIAGLTKDGSAFTFAKSAKTVAEVPTPPDLSVGKTIPSFEANAMDGKPVKFPEDYKGKIVMLDFWATWCGPCMREVPGLVAAAEKYKDRGFEVLGVTLDQANADQKINDVMAKNSMTWRQIYDGKGWQAAIAARFAINSIPATFLVDGDTGEILAVSNSLRGESLEKTIEEALKKKGK